MSQTGIIGIDDLTENEAAAELEVAHAAGSLASLRMRRWRGANGDRDGEEGRRDDAAAQASRAGESTTALVSAKKERLSLERPVVHHLSCLAIDGG